VVDSMTPYEAFQTYMAVKLHMTTEGYDIFRYNGKVKTTPNQFELRKDKWSFVKLSRLYPKQDDLRFFLATNFLENSHAYVRDLLTDSGCTNIYTLHLGALHSLVYNATQEMTALLHKYQSALFLTQVTTNELPILLKELQGGRVRWETVCVWVKLTDTMKFWETHITDDLIWPDLRLKILKYTPFLKLNVSELAHELLPLVTEFA
jgi:hypothetical protein